MAIVKCGESARSGFHARLNLRHFGGVRRAMNDNRESVADFRCDPIRDGSDCLARLAAERETRSAPDSASTWASPRVSGKTYKMLEEAHRRHDRGTMWSWFRRDLRAAPHRSLARRAGSRSGPVRSLPRRYRGCGRGRDGPGTRSFARHPHVALVDELAHTNVPARPARSAGRMWRRSRRRHQVISTCNVQHVE